MPNPLKNNLLKYCKYIPFENFNYSINISTLNRYIYVETPKVACSSIKLILHRLEIEDPKLEKEFRQIHDRKYSPLLKPTEVENFDKLLKQYFTFCFVRNPYTRLLSAYLDKIDSRKEDVWIKHRENYFEACGIKPKTEEELMRDISFEEFVKNISTHTSKQMDPHWRPQYDQTLQEYIDYSYIGKFENISEDLPEVLRKIFDRDIDEYLVEIVNHKTNANTKIKQYYTDEIRDMVYERYNKDFEYFEYPKDLLINKR
jgi:hypothetical protein